MCEAIQKTIRKGFLGLLVSPIFLAVFSSGPLLSQTQVSGRTQGPQPKFALLVGITNFKNEKINKIDGCENNVPLLADTLVKNFGFEEKELVTKLNAEASKDAIISTFRSHLVDNARKAKQSGKEAAVLFYFCGHGSQYPDQDKDENDGMDETFVAYDSRTTNVPDILDDEIDDLKAELRRETSNAIFILESCHSGTGTRESIVDKEYVTQEADADTNVRKPYVRKYPATRDEDMLTYTELSASASYRTAKSETEKYCNCAKPYSLMTKALVEALNRATPTTTYRQLMREISTRVSERSQQDPQVDGNRDGFLFGGAARRARPYIEIDRILPAENRIIIRAGKAHGLKVGSQVSIYASNAPTHVGTEGWLANGIVSDVRDFLADVKISTAIGNPKVREIKETSHVVFASPVFGGGPIVVMFDSTNSKPLTNEEAALHKAITAHTEEFGLLESGMVKFVATNRAATFEGDPPKGIVRLKRGTIESAFPNQKLVYWPRPAAKCDGDSLIWDESEKFDPTPVVYYLDDGNSGGTPLFGKFFSPKDTDLAYELARTIRNFALRANLRSLDNAASTLQSQIRVNVYQKGNVEIVNKCKEGRVTRESNPPWPADAAHQVVKSGRIPVGTGFSFSIENISGELRRKKDKDAGGEPLYATAIFLLSNGDIRVFPSTENDPLKDSGSKPFGAFLATKPEGVEQLIVVVSKHYVDFGFYNSMTTRTTAASPLERILSQSGTRSGGNGTLVPDEPDQWGVINIELNIVDKP